MSRPKLGTDTLPAHDRAVAEQIAEALGETAEQPFLQIALVVKTIGKERALAFLREAQEIEAAGGMQHAHGGRRTPGGVFFRLVRDGVSYDDRQTIFYKWRTPPKPGDPGAEHAGLPPIKWTERGSVLREAVPGKASSVKVTVIGRPGRVIERQGFALVLLTREGTPPSLPKGIPAPQKLPATRYALYIGSKQWRSNVAPYLDQDTADELIAEGTAFYDAEHNVIAVLVSNATTKGRERERRAQQQAAQTRPRS